MRIAILGGAGFVGTNLVEKLAMHNHEIAVIDNLSMGNRLHDANLNVQITVGDIANPLVLDEFLGNFDAEKIYHLAANSDIKNSAMNSSYDMQNTLLTTSSLLSYAYRNTIKELVFASSSAVYGMARGKSKEDSIPAPISAYGWTKLASEQLLTQASAEGCIQKLLIARFPNVTGMWQTHGVVFDLLNRLKQNNSILEVLGDGNQKKPYVLASELVNALEKLMEQQWIGSKVINLGPDSSTSVRKIVEIICNVTGLSPTIEYGNTPFGWTGDIPAYELDTTRSLEYFSDSPFITSDAAIERAANWFWSYLHA
jgi:UDP-glucose 4-epimerase